MNASPARLRLGALAASALIALLGACQSTPPQPLSLKDTQSVTATVEKIDVDKRLLTLKGPDGSSFTVKVDPVVQNLPQVHVGDKVVAQYTVGVVAQIVPKGQPIAPPSASLSADVAKPGAKPSASVGTTMSMTVTINSVDTKNNVVTFYGTDGLVRVLNVVTPEGQAFIKQLKAGDNVDVTFTEGFAVNVQPAG